MNRIVVFAIFLASTAAVSQETYKCKTAGGYVYQDRPCAGVRYAPPTAAVSPVPAPDTPKVVVPSAQAAPVAAQSDMERRRAYLATREKERRVADLKERIAHTEEAIAADQRARDSEIAYLQARSGNAKNNLAGATLEHAMAAEMQSVNARYATDISVKQDNLKRLRDELAQIK